MKENIKTQSAWILFAWCTKHSLYRWTHLLFGCTSKVKLIRCIDIDIVQIIMSISTLIFFPISSYMKTKTCLQKWGHDPPVEPWNLSVLYRIYSACYHRQKNKWIFYILVYIAIVFFLYFLTYHYVAVVCSCIVIPHWWHKMFVSNKSATTAQKPHVIAQFRHVPICLNNEQTELFYILR